MAAKITINIKSPCEEKWASMDPSAKGRFCQRCEKEVIDFSTLPDKELIAFFERNSKERVCGRFQKTQLNTYSTEKWKQKGLLKLALAGFTLLGIMKPIEAFSQGQPYVQIGEREYGTTPVTSKEQQSNPKQKGPKQKNSILIKGVVKDAETKETLPGVTIQIKESKIGTTTDLDGVFKLSMNKPEASSVSLLISFVGYETREIFIKADEREIYELEDSLLQLDVQVLGEVHYVKTSVFRRLWWRIKSIF